MLYESLWHWTVTDAFHSSATKKLSDLEKWSSIV